MNEDGTGAYAPVHYSSLNSTLIVWSTIFANLEIVVIDTTSSSLCVDISYLTTNCPMLFAIVGFSNLDIRSRTICGVMSNVLTTNSNISLNLQSSTDVNTQLLTISDKSALHNLMRQTIFGCVLRICVSISPSLD